VPAVKQQLLKIKTIKFFHVSTSVKAYKKWSGQIYLTRHSIRVNVI
jgi:hypothetical protein